MRPGPVIVTRPEREAARWTRELSARGFDATSLPLIVIQPVESPQALIESVNDLHDCAAVMFVSVAAVEHFMPHAQAAIDGAAPLRRTRFWATGPGTVRALEAAGVAATAIDAPLRDAGRFDSEALWERVRPQIGAGSRVLVVRGGDASGRSTGRDWLTREVEAAGGRCSQVVAYRRIAPHLDDGSRAVAQQATRAPAVWLFSSSEAIGNLGHAMRGASWHLARAVATHPRIGEAARQLGFGDVRVARPTLEAMVASIESFA